jgi:indolepyruvate ferredoxin oxidoreductase beta subunit
MSTRGMQLLVVGVGGQGVLTAAKVLANAAHSANHPVAVGQLHGMSQRGGSVECSVRLGDVQTSYIVGDTVDVLLGFEPLETLRAASAIGPRTLVVTSTVGIVPKTVTLGAASYPSLPDIERQLRERARGVVTVDGPALAKRAGANRSLNAVLLGALAGLGVLPFSPEAMLQALESRCSPAYLAANRRAFDLGLGCTSPGHMQEEASQ